jgi:hypothetical protein
MTSRAVNRYLEEILLRYMRANLKATKDIDDLEEENDDSSKYEDFDQSQLPKIEIEQGNELNLESKETGSDEPESEDDENVEDDEDN